MASGSGGPWQGHQRSLIAITALLGVLTVIHDVDHVRQGRALPAVLYAVGFGALVSIVITLMVLVWRPALSRPVAMAQGVAAVVGVGAVHAAPQWSTVTDSYGAADADALSWAIIIAMMGAGALLAVVAARSDA